jgi:hypothetical protein
LNGEKEGEVAGLNRNAKVIERCEKKMRTYQTLVDLDGDEEDGS